MGDRNDVTQSRRWLLLAASSLVVAGLLALALTLARMPPLDRLLPDPLLFRRALVVHVDLSLVVWFYSFAAALFSLLPAAGARSPLSAAAPFVALFGVFLLVGSAAVPGAAPILSNYVPVIDHPLFFAGLGAIGLGLLLAFVDPRLLAGREEPGGPAAPPCEVRPGLRAAALAVIVALLTIFASWLATPAWIDRAAYFEVLFWGGGHVLQVASEAAMVALWLWLLRGVLGRPVLPRAATAVLFGLLLAPVLVAPVLALRGTLDGAYRVGFTSLMQWGIFPVVSVFLVACAVAVVRARREGRLPSFGDARLLAFFGSAGLTVLGFVLGALIRGSNTMVPAHYHAAIGAVTCVFMGATYGLLGPLGLATPRGRLRAIARVQPLVYGVGQSVFALGFGIAGAHGMGRKVYGAEQAARGLPETIGLVVMGLGGLVAVAGGLAFLVVVIDAWRRAPARTERALPADRSDSWHPTSESIPSRS